MLERDILIVMVSGIIYPLIMIGWVSTTTALAAAGICLTVGAAASVDRIRECTDDSR